MLTRNLILLMRNLGPADGVIFGILVSVTALERALEIHYHLRQLKPVEMKKND